MTDLLLQLTRRGSEDRQKIPGFEKSIQESQVSSFVFPLVIFLRASSSFVCFLLPVLLYFPTLG